MSLMKLFFWSMDWTNRLINCLTLLIILSKAPAGWHRRTPKQSPQAICRYCVSIFAFPWFTPAPDRGGPVACLGGPIALFINPRTSWSLEHHEHHKKIIGRCWTHYGIVCSFCCKFTEKIGPKLRTIILLHLGLMTFRFGCGRTLKPWFSWFLDFGDL